MPGSAYQEKAVQSELAKLEGSTPGNQDNMINAVAFALARMVKGGWFPEYAIKQQFLDACGRLESAGRPWTSKDFLSKWSRAMREATPRPLPDGAHKPNGKHPPPPRPRKATIDAAELPYWTPPDTDGKPGFSGMGLDAPLKIEGERRRHIYVRKGVPVRAKIKYERKQGATGWIDVYHVRNKGGKRGWQQKRPREYVECPYFLREGIDPLDPEIAQERLYLCEGEKDADTLARAGECAISFGSSSQIIDCSDLVRGRHLGILGDNDEAGRKFAEKYARLLLAVTASIKTYTFPELKEGGDVTDYFEAGNSAEDFQKLIDGLPEYRPDFGYGSATYDQLKISAMPMLVKRLLPADPDALVFVGGQSEAGKTYFSIGLAMAAASGEPFLGFEVRRRAAVIYAAAEGQGTIDNRIMVAARHMGIERDVPFHVLKRPGAINEDFPKFVEDMERIAAYYKRKFGLDYCAFWLDTLSSGWAMEAKAESDAAFAAKTCQELRQIGQAIGGPVITMHHYGKDIEQGLRGSSNWKTQSDQVLSITAKKDEESGKTVRTLDLYRSRYGQTGVLGTVALSYEKLGINEDGDEFGDCSMILDGAAPKVKQTPRRSNQKLFEDCIVHCLASHGIMKRVDRDDPQVPMVKLFEHVRPIMRERFLSGEDGIEARADAFRKAWERAIRDINSRFHTRVTEDDKDYWVWVA